MTRPALSIIQVIASAMLLAAPVFGAVADYPPVTPADLALQKGRVDPNADAEYLLRDVRVNNEAQNAGEELLTTFTYFIRIKIFNEAGVKKLGTVDLPYDNTERVSDVTGRTIEPDGTVIELKRDSVFDHVVKKVQRNKSRARSFAMPGLKPGAIIEYRYKIFEDKVWRYVPLDTQFEFPVERAVFHIRPLDRNLIPGEQMMMRTFRVTPAPLKMEPDGSNVTSVENVPAFLREPDSPPDQDLMAWALVYYAEDSKQDVDRFWKKENRRLYQQSSSEIKVNGEVKQIADEVTSGAKTDDEKLAKIYYYCQKKIKNVYGHDASDVDLKGFKPNRNTAETLKQGKGSGYDITLAFIALAQAAGFDAEVAHLVDRETMIFRKDAMLPFMNIEDAAVNVNGKWRLYDPSTLWLGPGQLRWQEQYIQALVTGPKDPEFIIVPLLPAAESVVKQVGRLTLDEEGTAEGELSETLSGQNAAQWRGENIQHSVAEREKTFTDEIKYHLPGAEITNVKLSDPSDSSAPVTLSCQVKMEGFATRTGKRLFFNPAIFQINEVARYAAPNRTYDVLFQFPWSEVEDVSITFPQGFSLDNADLPPPINFNPVGGYETKAVRMNNRVLYHREFSFGKDGSVYFPTKVYPVLKKIFDAAHDNDAHMLAVKQDAPAMAAGKDSAEN